jgi:hypothetical protein
MAFPTSIGIQILLKKAPLLRYTVIRSIQGFLTDF